MSLFAQVQKRVGNFFLNAKFETGGETLSVLGASGAGKSLLLKCLAGIEKPDNGKIILNGRVLFDSETRIDLAPQKRSVGYLFQSCALFPNMTVFQNAVCAARDKDFAAHCLKNFGLAGKENLYPHMLSGGEKQRVALARLLASEPDALLFDEPFSALDSNRKSELERMILDLLEEKKRPSILVTHDRNEAFRLSKKISVMESGTLYEPMDKLDFFERPRTLSRAILGGCKNITRLEWNGGQSATALDWGMELSFSSVVPKNERKGFAGFRAHFFETGEKGGQNVFLCKIERVIEDAFSYVIYFRHDGFLGDSKSLLCWEVQKEVWKKIEPSLEQKKLFVKIDARRLMFLNKEGS